MGRRESSRTRGLGVAVGRRANQASHVDNSQEFFFLFFFFIKRDEKLWQDSELRCSRICLKRVILAAVKEVDWEQGGQTRIREEISSLGWKIAAGEHEGRLGLKCLRAERDWVCMRVGNGT